MSAPKGIEEVVAHLDDDFLFRMMADQAAASFRTMFADAPLRLQQARDRAAAGMESLHATRTLLQRLVDLVDSGEFRDGLPLRALARDAAELLTRSDK